MGKEKIESGHEPCVENLLKLMLEDDRTSEREGL